jgi:hypothetical protein
MLLLLLVLYQNPNRALALTRLPRALTYLSLLEF